jgi:hypothetical protein
MQSVSFLKQHFYVIDNYGINTEHFFLLAIPFAILQFPFYQLGLE